MRYLIIIYHKYGGIQQFSIQCIKSNLNTKIQPQHQFQPPHQFQPQHQNNNNYTGAGALTAELSGAEALTAKLSGAEALTAKLSGAEARTAKQCTFIHNSQHVLLK